MGDPNLHNHRRCPLLFLGKANGALEGNIHYRAPEGTPMSNVFVSLMQRLGHDDFRSSATAPPRSAHVPRTVHVVRQGPTDERTRGGSAGAVFAALLSRGRAGRRSARRGQKGDAAAVRRCSSRRRSNAAQATASPRTSPRAGNLESFEC
jgi:hypothetical protein